MERLLKRLVVLSLLISTGAMAHDDRDDRNDWDDILRMVRVGNNQSSPNEYLNLSATRTLSTSTPQLLNFQGIVKLPSEVQVSIGANLLGQGARLIFDDGRVECRYQQRSGGKFRLTTCTDGSEANEEFRVDRNIKFELLPVLIPSKAIVKIRVENNDDETYGVQFPYLRATEGQVLAYNGDAWVPMNPEDIFDGGGAGGVGPQGPAGAVGPQGPAGANGAAGAIGPQGPAGAAGVKGDKGDAGVAGAAGPVGPQGPAGANGAAGAIGPQGPAGVAGVKGDKGDAGVAGAAGAVGPQGPAGVAGVKGDKGDAGVAGAAGPVGPQGPAGVAGDKGDKGDTGAAGAAGATGPQGPAGVAGDKGDKGDTGATGAAGATGPQGPAGVAGDKGDKGETGATGPQGPIGATGATGAQGLKGDKGDTGAAGPQGPAGANGLNGAQGLPGAIGPQGPAGADGAVGPMGPQGPAGVSTGANVKVAFVKDVKAPLTNGGTCFASWTNRDLNTLEGDNSFASVSSNQLTLQPGTYWFEGHAPGYFAGAHQAKLVNVATNADVSFGSSGHSHPSAGSVTHSIIKVRLVIAAATTYKIQQRCSIERALQGFGIANGFGGPETYTTITIVKLD